MKKTGKALSLVLSLALVVSSLTMTFASAAASKTEYLPSDTVPTKINLVNGKSGSASLTTLSIPATVTDIPTSDHLKVGTLNIAEVAHKSGDSLVTLNLGTDKKVTAKLNSDTVVGTETIAVRYTVEDHRYTNVSENILFSYEKDYAITVHKLNGVSVDVVDLATKNSDGTPKLSGAVNKWIVDPTAAGTEPSTRVALDQPQKVYTKDDATKGQKSDGTATLAAAGTYIIKVASDGGNTVTLADGTDNNGFDATIAKKADNTTDYLAVGSTTFYATPVQTAAVKSADATVGADAVLDNANTLVGYGKVPNAVTLTDCKYITTWRGATWAVADNATTLAAETDNSVAKPTTSALNVTGCDVALTGATVMDKGTVGTVSGGETFTMNSGSVAAISGVTTATVNNGSVAGAVSATTEADVNGGTTGNIDAPTVKVNAVDEKVATQTGTISASTVAVKSDKAAVTTGAITKIGALGQVENGPADETANAITISGSKSTVGAIDCNSYKTTVDLKGFNGTIATPQNTASCVLKTEADGDTNTAATVTGNVAFSTITAGNGVLTIANSATADTVNGNGTLVIPAGALKVNKSIGSVSLKLSDPQLAVGTTVLYAPAYVVYDGSFKTVGYTLDYDAVNSGTKTGLQAFNIKSVSFAQLTIAPVDATSNKVAVGQKVTYKVSSYPAGTSLPDGTAIKFTFNGSSDNFAYTTTADTITIEAKKYEPLFNSLNKGTITATLVDANDNSVAKFGYDKATYDVQVIEKPEYTLTTTVTDLDGNVITATPDTVIPIQQSTQLRVHFNADNAGLKDINYFTGDDKTAQTGTVSAWDGTSGVYTIYTNGAVGSKTGVFAGGHKVFVVEIKDRPFKCDTSVDFSMKAGKTYTFKITPKDGLKINDFTFLTGNDAALSTWGYKIQADGTVMATVKAVSAGRYGVYAKINGTTYKVFAITVQ
jgi:hypothetical protein